MITPQQLTADLTRLGVNPDRDLFVHSSYKAVGPVEGAAAGIIKALQDAIPNATLLMPSFNLIQGGPEARAKNWHIDTTPSTVGYLTQAFRNTPGTIRSDHYSHSVAALGPKAQFYTTGHRDHSGFHSPWDLPPYGRTYGENSPFLKLYNQNAQLLMLGVDYHSATFMHVAETIDFNRRTSLATNPNSAYFFIDRPHMGLWVDRHCDVSSGPVGQAHSRLLNIRPFVDAITNQLKANPAYWFKWFEPEKL